MGEEKVVGTVKAVKSVWRLDVADEAETGALAKDLASLLATGDMVTLAGDLGVGKTTFARALIRELLHDPALEAPSPTFTIMQGYESDALRILHADFYRIEDGAELSGLGWRKRSRMRSSSSNGRSARRSLWRRIVSISA